MNKSVKMKTATHEGNLLTFHGSNFLKQRLILSILSGKSVQIIDIRSNDDQPGLRGYEVSLIRLFDKISNGSEIDINKSGTAVSFKPGILHGGVIHHDCNLERGIGTKIIGQIFQKTLQFQWYLIHTFLDFLGYYLDVLIALGPFCKIPINATLRGVTNSKDCPSVDHIKSSALPNLLKFLVVDEGLELKVKQRGMRPLGGGEVSFKCPVRKTLRSLQFGKPGMVKRIRGIAYTSKVSPALGNRAIEAAKGKLLQFIPDIYIYADQNKGKNAGNSPGFGISLVAETTDGVFYGAECVSNDISKVYFPKKS